MSVVGVFSFGIFRLGSLLWDIRLGILLAWQRPAGGFCQDLCFGKCGLRWLAQDLGLGALAYETSAWELGATCWRDTVGTCRTGVSTNCGRNSMGTFDANLDRNGDQKPKLWMATHTPEFNLPGDHLQPHFYLHSAAAEWSTSPLTEGRPTLLPVLIRFGAPQKS